MMSKSKKAAAVFLITICFLCIFSAVAYAETTTDIPVLSRDDLQYTVENNQTYHARTVFFTILAFIAAAILIPIAFSITEKIRSYRSKKADLTKSKVKKKKNK